MSKLETAIHVRHVQCSYKNMSDLAGTAKINSLITSDNTYFDVSPQNIYTINNKLLVLGNKLNQNW